MSREVMQQALDALEGLAEQQAMPDDFWKPTADALRAALAQPQAEPVAHLCIINTDAGPTKFFTAPSDPRGFPVFATPQQAQLIREVVVNADYREMWRQVTKSNRELCAALGAQQAQPAPAPAGWVMVPTHLTVDQLERFTGHGLCCGTEPMPEAVIYAGHRWARLLEKIAASPAAPAAPAVPEGMVQTIFGPAKDITQEFIQREVGDREGFERGWNAAKSAAPAVQPLSDEQIWMLATQCTIGGDPHIDKFARAIEQAHGIEAPGSAS